MQKRKKNQVSSIHFDTLQHIQETVTKLIKGKEDRKEDSVR